MKIIALQEAINCFYLLNIMYKNDKITHYMAFLLFIAVVLFGNMSYKQIIYLFTLQTMYGYLVMK
jgi:hypothetical protein